MVWLTRLWLATYQEPLQHFSSFTITLECRAVSLRRLMLFDVSHRFAKNFRDTCRIKPQSIVVSYFFRDVEM